MTAAFALIPAAGRGERFSTDPSGPDKILTNLLDRPVIRWSVEAFSSHPAIEGVVVVASAGNMNACRDALSGLNKIVAIIPGGGTRQESVALGLRCLECDPNDVVLVHDGARPLVTKDVIDRCLDEAVRKGAAVAAIPVTDTIKAADEEKRVQQTVPRDGLWSIQTPQAFRFDLLQKAHATARDEGFLGTDEASLVERFGNNPVYVVAGSADNLKITRPEDLEIAGALLRARTMGPQAVGETRVGFGYDIHRFAPGRRLMLGGVEFEGPQGRGLDGHSDADVLAHAICDALLGASGLPDIGVLYPNDDPQWEGAAGVALLSDVAGRVRAAGGRIVNIDASLIAEAPKIAPYVPRMRALIAEALCVDGARIGIKATTNERLGALGRGEGIAAQAVASVSFPH